MGKHKHGSPETSSEMGHYETWDCFCNGRKRGIKNWKGDEPTEETGFDKASFSPLKVPKDCS